MPKAARATKAAAPVIPAEEREAKLTTYVSEFVLSVGPMMTFGKLVNVGKRDKVGKFVTMCPECQTPEMKVRYACQNPNHMFTLADGGAVPAIYETNATLKAKKLDDGSYAPVDAEEVAAARQSTLPRDTIEMQVHPADEVNNLIWADDNAYLLMPRNAVDKAYAAITAAVTDGTYAFVGPCNLRNHEGFFRLAVWQDHLVLQKCLFPEECATVPGTVPTVDDKIVDALNGMLERVVVPFDPSAYINGTKVRMAALEEAIATGTTYAPPVPQTAAVPEVDLIAALEAFAANIKRKKK